MVLKTQVLIIVIKDSLYTKCSHMVLFKPSTISLKKFSFSNYKIQYDKHCGDKKK